MCIVSQRHCQSETVAQHRSQGNDSLPRHIGGILDTTRPEVAAGRAQTYGAYLLIATILLDKRDDLLTQCSDIIRHIRIVHRHKIVHRDNLSTDIHQSIGGLYFTDINTNDSRFDLINFFHIVMLYSFHITRTKNTPSHPRPIHSLRGYYVHLHPIQRSRISPYL